MSDGLTRSRATALAGITLGHVARPYPHKLDHVLVAAEADLTPQALHPLFFGSFDWHSCVHGYWCLARLLRLHPDLPQADEITALLHRQFVPEKVAGEVAYLERPSARGFERPYGWAWLLALASELDRQDTRAWGDALKPLAASIRVRFGAFLPLATYPVRVGTHFNTAFALLIAADHVATTDPELFALFQRKANIWYGADRDCQAWEPGGDDFLSPALVEAACMGRLMPPAKFRDWFGDFLPRLRTGEPSTLYSPVSVTDRTDGKLAHLDGLNLSRAWCWRAIARHLEPGDHRAERARVAADAHLAAGLPHLDGDYMGAHWLASFALLALDA